MPKQKKKNNADILILKIVKQEDEIANFELDTGAIDLAVILSSLRSRIPNNQKITSRQIYKFSNQSYQGKIY